MLASFSMKGNENSVMPVIDVNVNALLRNTPLINFLIRSLSFHMIVFENALLCPSL